MDIQNDKVISELLEVARRLADNATSMPPSVYTNDSFLTRERSRCSGTNGSASGGQRLPENPAIP